MANAEHIRVVLDGPLSISAWRTANPEQSLDLSGADLAGLHLGFLDLRRANLSNCNLEKAWLLSAALMDTNFERANLQYAKLAASNLYRSNFDHSNLSYADLSGANLGLANFKGANLFRANLFDANLRYCELDGANFKESNLEHATFHSCSLKGTDFEGSLFSSTVLAGLDLTEPSLLTESIHKEGSAVDFGTLLLTLGALENHWSEEVTTFFRNTGIPQELLDALPAIWADVEYHSAFISYGEPDIEMAERLVTDLRVRGVSCWMYKLDSTPGEQTWREISQKRREADKFVVLCSSAALIRDGVKKEIEEQIDEDPDKLVPISCDHVWTQKGFEVRRGDRDLKPSLTDRNYADFTDPPQYDRELERLLTALRRREV